MDSYHGMTTQEIRDRAERALGLGDPIAKRFKELQWSANILVELLRDHYPTITATGRKDDQGRRLYHCGLCGSIYPEYGPGNDEVAWA